MRSLLVLLLVAPLAFAEKKWVPADPAVECAKARDAALCTELLQMRDRDQIARYDVLNHPEDKVKKRWRASTTRISSAWRQSSRSTDGRGTRSSA